MAAGAAPGSSSVSSSSSSSSSSSTSSGASISIVGRVTHSYHFDRPADFQFLSAPAPESTAEASSSSRSSRWENTAPLLETVPTPFSVTQLPASTDGVRVAPLFETGFIAAASAAEELGKAPVVRINPQSLVVTVQAGQAIPQDPGWNYAELKERRENQADTVVTPEEMVARMKVLFRRRPVWTVKQFAFNSLLGQRYWVLKESLPYEAYFTSNGPMRQLWSQWGYDPGQDTKSRHYMVVHFRMNEPEFQRMNGRIIAAVQARGLYPAGLGLNLDSLQWVESELGDQLTAVELNSVVPFLVFGSSVVRKRFMNIQPCNVPYQSVIDFFAKAKILPVWNAETGWYSPQALKALRLLLLQAFDDRLSELLKNLPPVPAKVTRPQDDLGFPSEMFATQAIYDAMPDVAARSLREVEENNAELKPLVRGESVDKFKKQQTKRAGIATSSSSASSSSAAGAAARKKVKVEPRRHAQGDLHLGSSASAVPRAALLGLTAMGPTAMPAPIPGSLVLSAPLVALPAALPVPGVNVAPHVTAPVAAAVAAPVPPLRPSPVRAVASAPPKKPAHGAKVAAAAVPSAQQIMHSQIEGSQPFGMVLSSGSEFNSASESEGYGSEDFED